MTNDLCRTCEQSLSSRERIAKLEEALRRCAESPWKDTALVARQALGVKQQKEESK